MSAIAIITPDGNRVVGFRSSLPLPALRRALRDGETKDFERDPSVDTAGDWPLRFDQIYVAEDSQWRLYNADDLPLQYW